MKFNTVMLNTTTGAVLLAVAFLAQVMSCEDGNGSSDKGMSFSLEFTIHEDVSQVLGLKIGGDYIEIQGGSAVFDFVYTGSMDDVLVVTEVEGQEISIERVAPDLCTASYDYDMKKLEGWTFIETHELYIDQQGALQRYTNCDRFLKRKCVSISPDGRDEDGVSTHSLPRVNCTTMTMSLSGNEIEEGSCHAVHTKISNGTITMSYLIETEDMVLISAQLNHCIPDGGEEYPKIMSVPEDVPELGCIYQTSVERVDYLSGEPPETAWPSGGYWEIAEAQLGNDGILVGEVDIEFQTEDGARTYRLNGSFDLVLQCIPFD